MKTVNHKAITPLDRRILNIIQADFPLAPRPFLLVAEKVGSTEAEVLERVIQLKERGFIRRLGGVFWPALRR